jgi:hypothetical protein
MAWRFRMASSKQDVAATLGRDGDLSYYRIRLKTV